MKKILLSTFIIVAVLGSLTTASYASEANPKEPCVYQGSLEPTNKPCVSTPSSGGGAVSSVDTEDAYELLVPLPCPPGSTAGCVNGELVSYDTDVDKPLTSYLNIMMRIFIGICAVIAVAMIVVGGLEYATSELISSKESAKQRISGAILGLLIALGAYALLNTINPDLLRTDIEIKEATAKVRLAEQLKGYSGQGKCEQIPTGVCSPQNLTAAFGASAAQASAICNGESKGVADQASGSDKGSEPDSSFSFGLFQINILAHANEIKDGSGNLICSGIFQVDPNPPGKVGESRNDTTLGGCLEKDKTGSFCVKYAAKVINRTRYEACKKFVTNPEENIKYAASLQSRRGWGQWGWNASCRF